MKLDYLKPDELIIPLTLLAFVAPGVNFLNWALNDTTRWLVLAALTLFLMLARERPWSDIFSQPLIGGVMVYATWCLMTVFWSEVPMLSFFKAVVLYWVSIVFMTAGYAWAISHRGRDLLDVLWMFSIVALAATQGGVVEENLDLGSLVYAGLTGNPNLLGFMLFISSAWLAWQAFFAHREGERRRFYLFLGLYLFNLYFLLQSHSRASLISFVVIMTGFLIGTGRFWRWLPYIVLAVFTGYLAYSYNPSVNDLFTRYAFKASQEYLEDVGGDIWYSREAVWEASYELAMQGGLVGGGYGVTIGEAFTADIGPSVSSGQYGREQGNTQLAVMEQTGVVGLGLYLVLILSIFGTWLGGMLRVTQKYDRAALGLLGGALTGLLMQSLFEAWWVAPGSPESAMFWTLLGVMIGVSRPVLAESHAGVVNPESAVFMDGKGIVSERA